MAFSEGGWSWFTGAPRAEGDASPSWASEGSSRERSWASPSTDAAASVPNFVAPPMKKQSLERTNTVADSCVNIFSSSLPDLFHTKLGILDAQPQAQAVDEEKDDNEISLQELELRALGTLLPDDDELLAGVSNGVADSNTQDSEDVDLFSNSGGLELDGDTRSSDEQASRTLFVRNINSNVEDDELRLVFERFGDIRTLYTGCKHEGLILISYFDIRAARRALKALHNSTLWETTLEIHYLIPKDDALFESSQGMVAVYNVDRSISNNELKEIFSVYGEIKEVHESSLKQRLRYIEYYDARSSESALRALNRRDVQGKPNKFDPRLNPSSILQPNEELENDKFHQTPFLSSTGNLADPGSLGDLHNQAKYASFNHPLTSGSPLIRKPSDLGRAYHSYPEMDYGLMQHPRQASALSVLTSSEALGELALQRPPGFEHRGLPAGRPGLAGVPASSSVPFLWGSSHLAAHSPLFWAPSAQLYGLQGHPVLGYPQVRDRRRSFLRQAATGCVGLGSLRLNSAAGVGRPGHAERKGDLSKSLGRFGSRHRNRRADSSASDKEQFHLDIDRIISGEDKRTTLMLKNIPNKYTSKMLLAVIDEANQGMYDFIYLPIDFKNKCNVGYAFVNMIEPSFVMSFYKAFNGKKWEKFNSEKVASVAYARIQGKSALVAHFQNSSLMNECRPIVFGDEGNTPDDPGKEIGIVMGSPESAAASVIQ